LECQDQADLPLVLPNSDEIDEIGGFGPDPDAKSTDTFAFIVIDALGKPGLRSFDGIASMPLTSHKSQSRHRLFDLSQLCQLCTESRIWN
jgi:hypothetical protein